MAKGKKAEVASAGKWARVCVDESRASKKAVKLLRDAGFYVITIPVNGRTGPEVRLGKETYRGLREIEEVAATSGLPKESHK